jgi:2-(1,2-epoxy-1,2-dihydrophenyl)acetyl-CoA isomerase
MDTVLYAVRDGVATITLNRPESLNALTPEMNDRLVELVERADVDDDVRLTVLTGAGKAFSSGADLKLVGGADRLGRSALVGRQRTLAGGRRVERMLGREKPMIAAVNGVAAGMACAYALMADFALAAETARFLFSFVRLGFVPDSGTTWLLARRVGTAAAQRLCLTGEPVPAAEALRLGLVGEVVVDDRLPSRVEELAAKIAAQPVHAAKLARGLIERAAEVSLHQAIEAEAIANGVLGETEDHKEAVRAFAEKRQPRFTGR